VNRLRKITPIKNPTKHPIIIDPEFSALIPPMSADSLAQLEANICEHDVLDPYRNEALQMRQDYRPSPNIFIPEFPGRCNGSCHQRNIIPAHGLKLCPQCRDAKRRHSYSERGRWKDRERINVRRRLRRHDKRMGKAALNPFGPSRKPITELLRMATGFQMM
jgi:hypothetical protein